MNPAIDDEILNILLEEGINLICSVPCIMIAGVLKKLENTSITHIPVSREEEGVGIAAGISLGGGKPALIMQNSGLGNSINALLSLTKLYGLPLPLIISQRGGKGEKVLAQMPMGKATTNLLKAARIDYVVKGEMVTSLVSEIGVENIIFEAPDKSQQVYLILNLGINVNLGNIRPDDVIPLETLRRGLRGDTLGKL